MKYLALLCLVPLAACSFSPEHRVDLTIRNQTQKTVKLRASTFLFSRTIVLRPGESWSGWWDRRFVGKNAAFEIQEDAPEEDESARP
ncbi:MAG: hypothetical protein HYY16_01080 [Planctomycetes bacterium]|nr:hypothetical protein [Planctomycetota bacterium]